MYKDIEKKKDSVFGVKNISVEGSPKIPRHRWFHFKEAFSPEIVSKAIEDSSCSYDDLVIDVFSGSGTVPLVSAFNGSKALGFEVNPFMQFVSSTKLSQCRVETLDKFHKEVLSGAIVGCPSALESYSTFTEGDGLSKWLFNLDVLRAFEGGWQKTENKNKSAARDLNRLALIGAALDVANATKDGKCLRYRSEWEKKKFDKYDFFGAYEKRIEIIKEDLLVNPLMDHNASIKIADSRAFKHYSKMKEKFKLCVMSPPYLNSFDYTDVYRPELFLGKFVNSNEQLQKLRFETLRSHVQVKWAKPMSDNFGTHFKQAFSSISERVDSLWNKRIPMMIQAYFEDMKLILGNLKSVAKQDASVWIIVSTSSYAGIEIPVDLIIADIGSSMGWYLREVNVMRYLKRVSGQQWDQLSENKGDRPHLRESVIIFDANARKNVI